MTSRSTEPSPASRIPWWALTIAGALCLVVFALATRSSSAGVGGEPSAAIAPEPSMEGGAPSPGGPSMGGPSPSTGAIVTARPAAPMTLAAASETVSIEMYSAAWCTACSRAKAWLREQNISYHEIDVDQRTGAMGQLAVLNPRRTLPTFDVQGEVLVGFEPDRLATAIRGAARN